jgi:hypothetical protein
MRAVHGEVGKNIAVFQRHPPTDILSGIGSCFLAATNMLPNRSANFKRWVCTKKMFEYSLVLTFFLMVKLGLVRWRKPTAM